jgi:hypothetical protein
MKIKELKQTDYDRLFKAYEGLIDWIGANEVDGQETLGLLVKAVASIAVTNRLSKEDVLEVVAVTYEIEHSMRPKMNEVH